ncbi:MAG: hypothetical protein HRT72_02065 [Flavobacteriales bacterium]|nr:hypothetical protein [Flavobacteriales bacterium]
MNYNLIVAGVCAVGLIGFTPIYAGNNSSSNEGITHKGTIVSVKNAYQIKDAIYTWKAVTYNNNPVFTNHHIDNKESKPITTAKEIRVTTTKNKSIIGLVTSIIK